MSRTTLALFAGLLFAANTAAWQADPAPQPEVSPAPLTNEHVIALLRDGVSPEVVIAKIKRSKTAFDTSPVVLSDLARQGVPQSVVVAMVEASPSERETTKPQPLTDSVQRVGSPTERLLAGKSVYLLNESGDQKVFDHFPEKIAKWGRWQIAESRDKADLLLVFTERKDYIMSIGTATATAVGSTATAFGTSFPLFSDQRFLIAFDRSGERLVVISCERRLGSGYTTGVLINRMRKYIEKTEARSLQPK